MTLSSLMIGLASAIIFYLVLDMLTAGVGDKSKARIAKLKSRYGKKANPIKQVSLRLNTTVSEIKALDMFIKKCVPKVEALHYRLQRTGKPIKLSYYVLTNLIFVFGAMLWLQGAAGMALLPAFIGGIAIGVGVPHLLINKMIEKNARKFIQQFPEAIDMMVRGLKSGLPLTESFKTIAAEMPDPMSKEFKIIIEKLKIGEELPDILWYSAKRIGLPEFKFFITAFNIQRETGGNLTETLQNLSTVLRQRKQVQLKIKAMSSEARASAYIIGSLPFIMFALLMKMNYAYESQLIHDPRGNMMMVAGLFFVGLGALVMRKMIRFDVS